MVTIIARIDFNLYDRDWWLDGAWEGLKRIEHDFKEILSALKRANSVRSLELFF
jgi:hypothetical protein